MVLNCCVLYNVQLELFLRPTSVHESILKIKFCKNGKCFIMYVCQDTKKHKRTSRFTANKRYASYNTRNFDPLFKRLQYENQP